MYTISGWVKKRTGQFLRALHDYSIVPIKRTVFFSTVTVGKNTVRLIGTIE